MTSSSLSVDPTFQQSPMVTGNMSSNAGTTVAYANTNFSPLVKKQVSVWQGNKSSNATTQPSVSTDTSASPVDITISKPVQSSTPKGAPESATKANDNENLKTSDLDMSLTSNSSPSKRFVLSTSKLSEQPQERQHNKEDVFTINASKVSLVAGKSEGQPVECTQQMTTMRMMMERIGKEELEAQERIHIKEQESLKRIKKYEQESILRLQHIGNSLISFIIFTCTFCSFRVLPE